MTGIKLRIEHSPRAFRAFKVAVMLAGFACASLLWCAIVNVSVPRASFGEFAFVFAVGEFFVGMVFFNAIRMGK